MTETRRDRVLKLCYEYHITKDEFVQKTGFSEDQWYYWTGSGKKTGSPNSDQMQIICEAFDWSPTFIFYGLGARRLSEIKAASDCNNAEVQLLAVKNRQMEILSRLEKICSVLDFLQFSKGWKKL